RAPETPLRHRASVAADPPPGRELPARDLRCAQHLNARFRGERAPLPEPGRPNLRHHLQSRAPLVLAAAHAARGGAGVQGLRLGEGRPRPLVRPHRVRGPDLAAERAATREHRNPHAGVFLNRRRLRAQPRKLARLSAAPAGAPRAACPSPNASCKAALFNPKTVAHRHREHALRDPVPAGAKSAGGSAALAGPKNVFAVKDRADTLYCQVTVHDEANRGSTWADLTRRPLRGAWHA